MFGSPANSCNFSVSMSPISASKYMRFGLPRVITAIPSVTFVVNTSVFIGIPLQFEMFQRIFASPRKSMKMYARRYCSFEPSCVSDRGLSKGGPRSDTHDGSKEQYRRAYIFILFLGEAKIR